MALIVEDGTGLANAESYAAVADADTRLANLGMTDWALLVTAEKEQALRRAAAYMEQAYRERWQGYRRKIDQALSWPRWWVTVDQFPISPDIVPPVVANACIDLALKAAAGDLNADLERALVSKKTGPLEREWDRNSPEYKRYRAIDMALAPFLKGSNASVQLVRA